MRNSDERLPVGISSCLMGQAVRYDGKDKRNDAILEQFAPYFRWIGICPEVEIGMGIPRESVDLVRIGDEARMRGVESGRDWTERMNEYAAGRAAWLAKIGIAGYVFKSRSPSCGVQTVPLYARETGGREKGAVLELRDGLFAAVIRRAIPGLPIREETGLATSDARAVFLDEVRRYAAR